MPQSFFYGEPTHCVNRTCKHIFYKESHLGWMPFTGTECACIMRCPKCRDTFKIIQSIEDSYSYYESLPNDPVRVKKYQRAPITLEEIDKIKRRMETDHSILSKVFDNKKPGVNKVD